MKFIKYFFTILSFAIVFLTSCKRDVSLSPLDFQTTDYTNEAQLTSQLASIYNNVSSDLYSYALWGYLAGGNDECFRSDYTTAGSNVQILAESYQGNSADVNSYGTFWKKCYAGIEAANIIVANINQPVMDSTKRANILGQALFLRGFMYFQLVSHFGDVVLKTKLSSEMGTNFNLPRTPAKNIYAQVLSDMKRADSLVYTMDKAKTTSVVTKTAVEAMLARVCLYMAGNPLNDKSKYADALYWSNKVINSGLHTLNENTFSGSPVYPTQVTPAYSRLFINNMQNTTYDPANTEGIWDAAYLSKSNTTGPYANTGYTVSQQLGNLMGITSNITKYGTNTQVVGYSSGTYRAFPRLFKLYAPGDQRRDWAIAPYQYSTNITQSPFASITITGGGGTGAKASVTDYDISGGIASVTIDNGGSGYTTAPNVSLNAFWYSGTFTPPTLKANVSGGKVTSITIQNPGANFATLYDRPVAKWRREYEINLNQVTRLNNYTSCNFPIVRYADVLLMAAEADLMVNGGTPSASAVEYYNQVRRRAFGFQPSSTTSVDVTTFNMQDIMDERSRELCFEGLRRGDLLRWGPPNQPYILTAMQNLLSVVNANVPSNMSANATIAANNFISTYPKYLLFPIPYSELTLDPLLTQNPNW